jgi:antagonist of KipI
LSILINRPGILSTVQDLGRYGYQRFGVNPSGVMDRIAVRLINVLLGNDESEAVIEMHFPAAEVTFEAPVVFALGGADLGGELDGREVSNWKAVRAEAGSAIRFTERRKGQRIYLAVRGGFDIEPWLGSRSTNLAAGKGGVDGRPLEAGDRISISPAERPDAPGPRASISRSLIPIYSSFPTVRFIAGAEFDALTAKSEQDLRSSTFTVTPESNRMGCRLKGEPLYLLEKSELLSSAVGFGTIQLPPDGQLIVLMADHQTTGGYPRIGHVISTDLPLLSQLGPGDKTAFHLVTMSEAEGLLLQFERDLRLFTLGVGFADRARE